MQLLLIYLEGGNSYAQIHMPYYTEKQIDQARSIDLLTYLQSFEPTELVRVRGNTYCTREHDSLKISNGKWMWWSRGFGGNSALDYLIKVKGIYHIYNRSFYWLQSCVQTWTALFLLWNFNVCTLLTPSFSESQRVRPLTHRRLLKYAVVFYYSECY